MPASGGPGERLAQRGLLLYRDLSQELDRQVNALGGNPSHGEPQLPQPGHRIPEALAHPVGEVEGDE